MPMADGDAQFIFRTEAWHLGALFVSLTVNGYFFSKGNRSPLFRSYLMIQGALILWLVSKIGKTVAPDINIRWFFIVTQYLAVCYLGPLFLFFSWNFALYRRQPPFLKPLLYTLSFLLFLGAATNPLHFRFYATFDFYRDTFGPLFYLETAYTYTLVLFSIIFSFRAVILHSRSVWDLLIGLAGFLPLLLNVFYLTDVINPLFDITPIAMTGSLIFFGTAAYRSHFLGLLPIARDALIEHLEDPLILTDSRDNPLHTHIFPKGSYPADRIESRGRVYRKHSRQNSRGRKLYHYVDITDWEMLTEDLQNRNGELRETIDAIQEENRNKLRYMELRWINHSRRELHDILGHSLTQVIMLLRLSLIGSSGEGERNRCLEESSRLIDRSLDDLKVSLKNPLGEEQILTIALQKIIEDFPGDRGILEFTVRGRERSFSAGTVTHLTRCCQEGITNALKHGRADKIYLTLLFGRERLRLIISDTGRGCSSLTAGNGLSMMGKRVEEIGGKFKVCCEEEEGFQITITVPLEQESTGERESMNIS